MNEKGKRTYTLEQMRLRTFLVEVKPNMRNDTPASE